MARTTLALLVTLIGSAHSETMPKSVAVCRSIIEEAARLQCYDKTVDNASKPVATTQFDAPNAPNQTRSALLKQPSEPDAKQVKATRAVLTRAIVAALERRASGTVRVTLDNGQSWTQYSVEEQMPLRVGDEIIIRPSIFGASILATPSGWITKVHPSTQSASQQ